MDLYLIRHADAVPVGEQGVTADSQRPLSRLGLSQVQELTAALSARQVHLDKIVSSPLVRARQTAEWMLKAFPLPPPELLICEELAPGGKRRRLSRYLREQGGDAVALVGHLPDLAELAAWLIGSRNARIDMAKAGAAFVRCDDGPQKGAGSLIWLTTPDWYT
jgi:phosphohistidine phosphatase